MKDLRIDYVFDGIALGLASVQVNEIMQYIQLGAGILATLISVAFSIWKWWKKASSDGKITKEEIKDGIKEIADTIKDKKGKE